MVFSIIINPFGEAYPESRNAEGVGFKNNSCRNICSRKS
jgi:hypothetical protein